MEAFKYFALLLTCISATAGQNCGITGVTNSTILVQALNETTPAGTFVWSQDTYNVTATAAISNPSVKYINGLRYPTRYEYVTADIFPQFVQSERSNSIRRDVVFTCSDGKTKAYSFVIPVNDENTEPPTFSQRQYNATVSQSNNSTEPFNANIIVSDADLELRNAQVILRSSNALITPFVNPQWEGQYPDSYIYRMDFIISASLQPGQYQIILTADDGKFSDSASMSLTITA